MRNVFDSIEQPGREDVPAERVGPRCVSLAGVLAGELGFVPDERQAAVLAGDTRRLLLCCTRQWGKSLTIAALAVWRAWEHPGRLILVVSPTFRQSEEFLAKAKEMAERAGVFGRRRGRKEFRLLNGSRLVAEPAVKGNLRGYSAPQLVILDEAAQVPDQVYQELRPMLAAGGGELALLSTPFGRRGFFWKEWEQGGEGWRREQVTAEECPRIPAAFLAEERRAQGEDWFAQEYLCRFLGLDDAMVRSQWLQAAEARGLDVAALELPLWFEGV